MVSGDKVFTTGVKGKIIDRIVLSDDNEEITIEVCFTDNTTFNVWLVPGGIQTEGVEILRWKDGNSRVVKKLL